MEKKKQKWIMDDIQYEREEERAESRKVYQMKNGLRMMVLSGEPLHCRNTKTGRYEEIGNRLVSGKEGLTGKRGNFRIGLPDGKVNFGKVSVKCASYGIEWEYIGMEEDISENFSETKKLPVPRIDYLDSNPAYMKKSSSSKYGRHAVVQYRRIEDGIDLEYEVKNHALKENIIIRKCRERYTFCFHMRAKNLEPSLLADGSAIEFCSVGEKKRLFRIPAPYMTDAADRRSEAVLYRLDKTKDGDYIFRISADAAWINDAERTLPVTIDPYLEYGNIGNAPLQYQNTIGGFEGIATGFNDTLAWGSHLLADISWIPASAKICGAVLSLSQKFSGGNADFYWCLQSFRQTIVESPKENGHVYHLDVTETVEAAKQACGSFCGFTLSPKTYKIPGETGGDGCGTSGCTGTGGSACCSESDCSNPCIGINAGIEFFGSSAMLLVLYTVREQYVSDQSLIPVTLSGSSMNGYINLFTGDLLYQQEDMHSGGAALPFVISHYFDINQKSRNGIYGRGWNISLNQEVEMLSGYTADACYTDEQGKKHYFVTENGVMKDTDGLNLTLTRNMTGSVICDRSGGKLTFNSHGQLIEMADANSNRILITRDDESRITQVQDSGGRGASLYYVNGKLDMIGDPAGRMIIYRYDVSGHLIEIEYPDGSSAEFTYDAAHRLICAKERDDTKTVYQYSSGDKAVRCERYGSQESIETSEPEEYMKIDYRSSRSTAVTDRTGIRKVYVFDATGRAELEYEDVPMELDGEVISNRFQVTGTVLYRYTEKKRTFGTSVRTVENSNNLISNGSFEEGSESPWQFVGKRTVICGQADGDGIVQTSSADQSTAYQISGVPYMDKYLKQRIPASRIALNIGDTLILSAWAKADSAATGDDGSTKFEIRAETRYTDGTVEEQNVRYDSHYQGWQYAALPIRISRSKTLSSITVYLDYSHNQNTCLFDNVRLVNAPSQSITYEENLNETAVIFGTAQTVKKRTSMHDGLYTVTEEKNSSYDIVRRTVTDLDGNEFVSVFAYDDAHHVIRSQNERKMMTEYTYNEKGMPTSSKSYYWGTFNPDIQRETITASEYFKSETSYESTGEFATGISDARSEGIKTLNSYNTTKGLLLSTTTPNGQTISYTYDAATDLVTSVRATVGEEMYSVLYGYTNRKLSSITRGGFAYGFSYDGMGRAKKVTIAGEDYTENTYTVGETTTVTTTYASGEKMTVETDRHDQPVKRIYADKDGMETVIAEGEYDSLGKAIRILDKTCQKEYTYSYDGYENITTETINGETFKEYEYDSQNRLSKTVFHLGNETQTYRPIYERRAADEAVYADNAVVGVTLDGAFTSRAEQDCYGRVTEKKLTIEGSTEALLAESYGYLETSAGFETRLTGMVQVLTRRVKGEIKDTQRYTYDNNGNITAVRNGSGTEYHAKYTYDGINQLIREDNAVLGKSWTFSYDTAGNILSKKEYAYTTGTLGSVLDTKIYTYAGTGWKDRLISWDGEAIEYDAMGNPTTYLGHALTWGKIRQLESYRIDSNTLLTYAYDAGGVRIRKGAVSYQVDGNRILRETRPAGTITYEYGNGGVCGFQYDNTKYYYEKNLQGDITGIYDADGNLKAEYVYDTWGNPVVTVDIDGIGTLNPFRYRGYYYDTETELYYLNSRYYDPRTCRFISADILLDTRTFPGYNLFAYCLNNPVIFHDMGGSFAITIAAGLAALGFLTIGLLYTGSAIQASQDIAKIHPISSSGLNGVNITPFPKLGLIEYLDYKIRVKKIEREIEKAKEQERTNREGPIYYHVTSSEVAAKIMSTGIITPGEGGFVYAWKLPPTLEAINNSGARFIGSGSVTISFRTNAAFVPDPEIDGQTRPYKPVRTYFPGAIRVTDIHIVRFGRR